MLEGLLPAASTTRALEEERGSGSEQGAIGLNRG